MNRSLFFILILSCVAYLLHLLFLSPFSLTFTCIFSYLLIPIVNYFTMRYNISRGFVSVIIVCLLVTIISLFIVYFMPIFYHQTHILYQKLPAYKDILQSSLEKYAYQIKPNFLNQANLIKSIDKIIDSIFAIILDKSKNIWSYTIATLNILITFLLFPIVLYYMLKEWPHIKSFIYSLIPESAKKNFTITIEEIDRLISSYLIGQLNVVLIMSCYYLVCFLLLKIDLGILLGIISGVMIIIPFIGYLISLFTAIIMCYLTYGISTKMNILLFVFLFGYLSEVYLITPNIIGKRIGIHPILLIFSAFILGNLFGFVGILFALPIAGIIKLFLVKIIHYYKTTDIYKS